MHQRTASKLLIVGWDAADWHVIDPLLSRGAMPTLARVIKAGLRADLSTLDPKLSPILWTTIATGKTADKHGILNFVEPDPASADGAGLRISTSTTRKTKALWNILTQAGMRTNVVSWYASHPAEPIAGHAVSNLFRESMPRSATDPWPLAPGAVHPADLSDLIAAARVHPSSVQRYQMLSLVPGLAKAARNDHRVSILAGNLAECLSVHNAACELLRRPEPWDCTMVFYNTIDVVSHHFMQYYPPKLKHVSPADFELYKGVIPGIYKMQDTMLGTLLDLAGPGTTLILLSDHGFHSDERRTAPAPEKEEDFGAMDAASHREFGALAMSGPGVRKGATVRGPRLLDVTPTALTLLGLPVGADMDGRVLTEALERDPAIERIPSWDAVESAHGAGLHPADLRQDPFEARDTMAQLAALGYIAAPSGDDQSRLDRAARETRFNLAVVYMTTQRVTEALPIFEELYRADPQNFRYMMSFARCCADRGRFADARAAFGSYLEAHPDDIPARMNLGATLFAEGKCEEAAVLLEKLRREITPAAKAELECLFGTTYFYLRRPDDAHRAFSAAVAADRQNPQAHHGIALAAIGHRRFEKAAEHCLAALGLLQAFPDAHYTLGVALAWLGDLPHAVQSFQIALTLQPGMIAAHRFLAAILRERGDEAGAVEHQKKADELLASRAAALDGAGAHDREPPFGPGEWSARSSDS